MKRFFSVIVALVMLAGATSASAQGHRHGHGGHHDVYSVADGLGISFGYVHSAYRLSDWATDEVETMDGLDGFNIGLTKDFPLIRSDAIPPDRSRIYLSERLQKHVGIGSETCG